MVQYKDVVVEADEEVAAVVEETHSSEGLVQEDLSQQLLPLLPHLDGAIRAGKCQGLIF